MEKGILNKVRKHLICELENTLHFKFIYDSTLVGTSEVRQQFFEDFAFQFNEKYSTNITGILIKIICIL